MEHAGERGVQHSGGAEMEAYGDHAAAASNQFFCKSREKSSRKPCITNIEGYNWQGQTGVTCIFATTYDASMKCTECE